MVEVPLARRRSKQGAGCADLGSGEAVPGARDVTGRTSALSSKPAAPTELACFWGGFVGLSGKIPPDGDPERPIRRNVRRSDRGKPLDSPAVGACLSDIAPYDSYH